MSVRAKSTKDEKQLAVSIAILEIINREGLGGVTHSKVSRRSKVSRAWIYEYIGKEKEVLIEFAADVIASYFANAKLALPQTKSAMDLQLKDGIDFLFTTAQLNPVAVSLYYRFRGSTNPIGRVIQKYEKHWLDGASKTLVNVLGMSPEQASRLAELGLTLRMGFAHRIVTSSNPAKARRQSEETLSLIHAFLSGGFEAVGSQS